MSDDGFLKILSRWKSSPTMMVLEAFGVKPDPFQAEALTHLATKPATFEDYLQGRLVSGPISQTEYDNLRQEYETGVFGKVTIRSGHGVGKSTLEAWAVLWMLTTHYPVKIPCTATSRDQLQDVLFSEIAKWHSKMPEALRSEIEVTSDRAVLASNPTQAFAVARTARQEKPEALQGFHGENLLFVLDEASGIYDIVFEVAEGALTAPNAKALMCGNPTRSQGYFYDSHTRLKGLWHTMRVSCLDSHRVSPEYVESCKIRYGEGSNAFRVRVLGDFPTGDDDAIIPLWLAEEAIGRDIRDDKSAPIVWGVDVARYGDDRTTLCKRRKNRVLEPIMSWRNLDTMQTASLVTSEFENAKEPPDEILVDVIGVGAGVVDRLRENGLPVRGVNVAESPSVKERFHRLRDELWWMAREWFEQRAGSIPDQEELVRELSMPRYKDMGSKIRVESKSEVKSRTIHKESPDLADAFILTFASGLLKRKHARKIKYPTNREAGIV